jgi:hypothetical protein
MLKRSTPEGADPESHTIWSRGLPVDVLDYDARFGSGETPVLSDAFIPLVLLDLSYDEVHDGLCVPYEDKESEIYMLRAYRVHLDEFPPLLLAEIDAFGFPEVTHAQVRPYIRHRLTGECW